MAEFPALPLWTDAYLADTRLLSTLEHGAYLLLIMEAWRRPHCDLPDDDRLLARMAGLSIAEWDEIKSVIMGFWKLDGRKKTWTQKKLSKTRGQVANKSRSQKDKAAKRWNNTEKDDATALPEHMPEPCPDDATKTKTKTIVREPDGSLPLPPNDHATGQGWPAIPDWVPVRQWNAFVVMRKRKRANPTARAVELLIAKLDHLRTSGNDPGAVLDQSTLANWTDIYPLKDRQNGTGHSPRNDDQPRDPYVQASLERKAERAAAERG